MNWRTEVMFLSEHSCQWHKALEGNGFGNSEASGCQNKRYWPQPSAPQTITQTHTEFKPVLVHVDHAVGQITAFNFLSPR